MGKLTILKSDDAITIENIIITIIGYPGAGKTTTALSADKPLLLDFDNGIQRSARRGDCIRIKNWDDLAEFNIEHLSEYKTIIIDTVGKALEVLSVELIKRNPKLARSSGELTLQAYGALSSTFRNFLNKLKSFGKDIILIGHAKEMAQGDNTVIRIDAMGNSKDELVKCSDLLGFMEADNEGIRLNFNPTERHLGKNCAGFSTLRIPHVDTDSTFMAEIIAKTKEKINALSAEQTDKIESIQRFNDLLANNIDTESLTELTKLEFLAEKPYLKILLVNHAKKLGFKYVKEVGFVDEKLEKQVDESIAN